MQSAFLLMSTTPQRGRFFSDLQFEDLSLTVVPTRHGEELGARRESTQKRRQDEGDDNDAILYFGFNGYQSENRQRDKCWQLSSFCHGGVASRSQRFKRKKIKGIVILM